MAGGLKRLVLLTIVTYFACNVGESTVTNSTDITSPRTITAVTEQILTEKETTHTTLQTSTKRTTQTIATRVKPTNQDTTTTSVTTTRKTGRQGNQEGVISALADSLTVCGVLIIALILALTFISVRYCRLKTDSGHHKISDGYSAAHPHSDSDVTRYRDLGVTNSESQENVSPASVIYENTRETLYENITPKDQTEIYENFNPQIPTGK